MLFEVGFEFVPKRRKSNQIICQYPDIAIKSKFTNQAEKLYGVIII